METIEGIRNMVFPKRIREISVDITPITPLILFSLFSIAFIKITENIAVITNSTPSEQFVRAPPIRDPRVTDKTQQLWSRRDTKNMNQPSSMFSGTSALQLMEKVSSHIEYMRQRLIRPLPLYFFNIVRPQKICLTCTKRERKKTANG